MSFSQKTLSQALSNSSKSQQQNLLNDNDNQLSDRISNKQQIPNTIQKQLFRIQIIKGKSSYQPFTYLQKTLDILRKYMSDKSQKFYIYVNSQGAIFLSNKLVNDYQTLINTQSQNGSGQCLYFIHLNQNLILAQKISPNFKEGIFSLNIQQFNKTFTTNAPGTVLTFFFSQNCIKFRNKYYKNKGGLQFIWEFQQSQTIIIKKSKDDKQIYFPLQKPSELQRSLRKQMMFQLNAKNILQLKNMNKFSSCEFILQSKLIRFLIFNNEKQNERDNSQNIATFLQEQLQDYKYQKIKQFMGQDYIFQFHNNVLYNFFRMCYKFKIPIACQLNQYDPQNVPHNYKKNQFVLKRRFSIEFHALLQEQQKEAIVLIVPVQPINYSLKQKQITQQLEYKQKNPQQKSGKIKAFSNNTSYKNNKAINQLNQNFRKINLNSISIIQAKKQQLKYFQKKKRQFQNMNQRYLKDQQNKHKIIKSQLKQKQQQYQQQQQQQQQQLQNVKKHFAQLYDVTVSYIQNSQVQYLQQQQDQQQQNIQNQYQPYDNVIYQGFYGQNFKSKYFIKDNSIQINQNTKNNNSKGLLSKKNK